MSQSMVVLAGGATLIGLGVCAAWGTAALGAARGTARDAAEAAAEAAAEGAVQREDPAARVPPAGRTGEAAARSPGATQAPLTDPPRRHDGPARVPVPAGSFLQGSTKGDDDERPVHPHVLKAFFIDKTEVTRAAYLACVAAQRCRRIPERFLAPIGGEGNLPVTGVSWFDARDYCRYAGGRLPTEAEWEKAARGTDGREYPWGNDPACERANWGNYEGEGPCAAAGNPGFPVAVGRYESGASPYGALDMAGNAWEWVSDAYDEEPSRRVVRGGSCCTYFVPPRAANRNAWEPKYRDGDLGFRCVADR